MDEILTMNLFISKCTGIRVILVIIFLLAKNNVALSQMQNPLHCFPYEKVIRSYFNISDTVRQFKWEDFISSFYYRVIESTKDSLVYIAIFECRSLHSKPKILIRNENSYKVLLGWNFNSDWKYLSEAIAYINMKKQSLMKDWISNETALKYINIYQSINPKGLEREELISTIEERTYVVQFEFNCP